MISRLIVSFFIILVIFECSGQITAPVPNVDQITNAEYLVLATIVDSLYHDASDSELILADSTCTGSFGDDPDSSLTITLQYVARHIPALQLKTMQNFKSRNFTPVSIQRPSRIHPACVLASKSQHHYPGLEVSRVGFSANGLQALAYVGRMDAPLAGGGFYHVLSKKNEKWIIIGTVMIWRS